MNRRELLTGGMSMLALSQVAQADKTSKFSAEAATLVGGARRLPDRDAFAGYLVALTKPGDGVTFTQMPAGRHLAVHYASTSVARKRVV